MTTLESPALISHVATTVPHTRGLRPFDHQVAGQSIILHYDDTTICKCLTQREYKFYQARPDCLCPFIPQFRGVIQVYLPDPDSHDCPPDCQCSRPHHHHPSSPGVPFGWFQNVCPHPGDVRQGFELDPRRMRALKKTTRHTDTNRNLYYFMLLEDLMAGYKKPCVFDLKIGVRQHGDDAPPEKVAYQVNKCKSTTSASLGIRLCGMKKYLTSTRDYEKLDKTQGRQLSEDDLKSQIVNFLFNGQELHLKLVDSILFQLRQLKNVVEQLESYRFYSCSLLIIYEGDVEVEGEVQYDQRDSEHSDNLVDSHLQKYDEDLEDDDSDSSDNDCPEQTIIDVCDHSEPTEVSSDSSQDPYIEKQTTSADKENCKCHYNSSSIQSDRSKVPCNSQSTRKQPYTADVRVVDFAHATFDGFLGDTVKHYGPDHGFLLGLNTLLDVFGDLKERDEL